MEHRWGRRYDTDVAVRFVALPGTIGSGRVTNISLSGAFMETRAKLRLLTVIYIEGLDSSADRVKPGIPKRLAATVVRSCSAGVGLEWCESCAYPASEFAAAQSRNPPALQVHTLERPPAAPVGEPRAYQLDLIK